MDEQNINQSISNKDTGRMTRTFSANIKRSSQNPKDQTIQSPQSQSSNNQLDQMKELFSKPSSIVQRNSQRRAGLEDNNLENGQNSSRFKRNMAQKKEENIDYSIEIKQNNITPSIDQPILQLILGKYPQYRNFNELNFVKESLSHLDIFQSWNENQLIAQSFTKTEEQQIDDQQQALLIYKYLFFRSFNKYTALFYQDDLPRECYAILKGEVLVLQKESQRKEKKTEQQIAQMLLDFELNIDEYNKILEYYPNNTIIGRISKTYQDQYLYFKTLLKKQHKVFINFIKKFPSINQCFSFSLQQVFFELKRDYCRNNQILLVLYQQNGFIYQAQHIKIKLYFQIIEQGRLFGEIALYYQETRTATVISISDDLQIGCLDSNSFKITLKAQVGRQTERILDFLSSISLFKGIDNNKLNVLALSCDVIQRNINTILYKENQPIDYVYFVINGEVEISQSIQQKANQSTSQAKSINDSQNKSLDKSNYQSKNADEVYDDDEQILQDVKEAFLLNKFYKPQNVRSKSNGERTKKQESNTSDNFKKLQQLAEEKQYNYIRLKKYSKQNVSFIVGRNEIFGCQIENYEKRTSSAKVISSSIQLARVKSSVFFDIVVNSFHKSYPHIDIIKTLSLKNEKLQINYFKIINLKLEYLSSHFYLNIIQKFFLIHEFMQNHQQYFIIQ